MRNGLGGVAIIAAALLLAGCGATAETARADCLKEVERIARDTSKWEIRDLIIGKPKGGTSARNIPYWEGALTIVTPEGHAHDQLWNCSYQIDSGKAYLNVKVF